MKKRGMELTISTLVVIILSLLILVVGVIFVRTTFCKAMHGVNTMADLSNQEIQNLFSEQDNNVAVKEQTNEIPKNTYYGVGFAIENDGAASQFTYNVTVFDLEDCHISQKDAESYIITARNSKFNVVAGTTYSDVMEFKIPKEAPLCSLKYQIDVKKNNQPYGSTRFEVMIKQSPWTNSLLC